MKSALLIINYNDATTTMKLLENVESYSSLNKIVVVDNHSTDDSYEVLKKKETSKIKIIKTKENKGYSSGINFGARYLIEKFDIENILVSNADIIIENEKDLQKLMQEAKKATVGVVAPVILEKGEKNRGWRLPTIGIDILMNTPLLHRWVHKNKLLYEEKEYHSKITEVEAVSGCFFLVKGSVLKRIGFLDENTFLYYEENILGSILKKYGYKTIIVNGSHVIHNHSVSIDKSVSKLRKYKILKQSQYYYEKEYQKAGKISLFFLKCTSNIGYLFYNIYYRIQDSKGGKK